MNGGPNDHAEHPDDAHTEIIESHTQPPDGEVLRLAVWPASESFPVVSRAGHSFVGLAGSRRRLGADR
jgi:hypothetical protein